MHFVTVVLAFIRAASELSELPLQGEMRLVFVGGTPVEVITKRAAKTNSNAGSSADDFSYEYTSYQPNDPQYRVLVQAVQEDLKVNGSADGFMGRLGAGEVAGQAHALPLIWTIDLVAADLGAADQAEETSGVGYHVVAMSCECVGVNKRLHLAADVAKHAIAIASECQARRDAEEYSRE